MKNIYLFIKVLMKLSFYGIFIQVLFLNVLIASNGSAQGYKSLSEVYIELDAKDLTIKGLFSEIESHTSFEFNYDDKSIDKRATVKLSETRQSVEELLVSAGRSANLHFRRINNNISVQKASTKTGNNEIVMELEDILVKGKITDEAGEPLPGATIIIKSTNQGTTSDIEGNYAIQVSEDGILIVSFVGYTVMEVVVANRSVIDVQLQPDVSTLAEVVVVGYTEKDTRKLTSSIAVVNSDRIQQVPMATFDNILQGAAPGMLVQSGTGQPGRPADIAIRGVKSINSSTAPLYILDGIEITGGDFAAINPNDIGSVSILKDAAATQIYGSRGATGVIVITSKSGVKGESKLEYHTFFGISPKPKYNDGLRPLTSAQLIDLQHEIGIGATVGLSQTVLDSLKLINTDWLDATTRNAKIQSHEVSFSGGSNNTRFYISGSYFSQEGTSLRSKLDRYSLRTKVDYEKNNFSIGSSLYLAHTETEDSESEGSFGRSNPFYSSIRANPYDHVYDPTTGEYALPLDLSASSTFNILERIKTNDENRSINQAIASLNGRYKIPFVKGLSVASRWSVNFSQREEIDYIDPNSFSGPRSQGGQGRLAHDFSRRVRFTGTNSIHYDFNIEDDHFFNVAAYQEFVYYNRSDTEIEVFGLDKIQTISGATPGADGNGFIPTFGGLTDENSLSSYFATIDYSYKNRYNVTGGIRRDGSSNFGSNNRFGNFYSVGLGWTLSEENFMSSLAFVNYAKFRASYGTVGNQRINERPDSNGESVSSTAARAVFGATAAYNGASGLVSNLANPDLKWEQTEKLNIGFDLTAFNDFVTMNVDWYNETTVDLLLNVPISRTTGFSNQTRNSGTLRNRGIELAITTKNLNWNGFKWITSLNLAKNKTTVEKLPDGSFKIGDFLYEEGKELGVYNLVRREGINPANGKTLWYDKEGNLTETYNEDDAVNIAPSLPKYHGGFTNTFSYKGLELRVFVSFAQGHSIFNTVRTSLDNPTKISRGSVSQNALRFWRQPGDITDLPDPNKQATYEGDSGWLEDASYVRLRNVILSYNLPSSIVNKLKVSGIRIYAQGQNLYTWTTFSGLDPENTAANYVADYPSLSTYTMGLDVKF
ncbi:MAG: SusC/RagA family TonB-linked outer membrane protein [Reichenbachiella sp.]|uniref:SusC/RagA family TonB-linked outer membrane protein n=1 Tax=Reichenbachiella sp. TaxID=2184521 RepID=UPI003265F0CB